MPKDPTRNVDRYKVRGGQFDDLDRTKNDGRMTEDAAPLTGGPEETNFIPGESPQEAAERKQRLIEEVHAKAEQRRQAEGAAASKTARAGRGKAAAKKSTKKSATKSAKKSAKASAGGAKKGAKKASGASKKAGKGRGAAGAKKGAKAAAGKKAARGGRSAGGAKKSVQKRAGKKVAAKSNRSRAGRPGAG